MAAEDFHPGGMYGGHHVHLAEHPNGRWRYRWWDEGSSYLRGHAPDRETEALSLQACLPMLLADHARASLTRELRGPAPQV